MRLIFLFIMLLAAPAYAQICTQSNTGTEGCNALGYTQTKNDCIDSEGKSIGGIACPFDSSKWICSPWKCSDGRYSDSPTKEGYTCYKTIFKKITCYDCIKDCVAPEIDYDTCWGGRFMKVITECEEQGYTDLPESCDNYLRCPSDYTKIRCIG